MAYFRLRRIILYLFIFICPSATHGQDSQLNPAGGWFFNPSWFNPAISGSKDYNSLGFTYATGENYKAMVLYGNARFSKKISGYYNIPDHFRYRNIGIGYQAFHKSTDLVNSSGFKVTGSYHVRLNETYTSFLSIGLSFQGSMNKVTSSPTIEPPGGTTTETTYDPNIDFGIYYYNPAFYIGLSSTGILEGMLPGDTITYNHEKRNYHLLSGYKIVLYRSKNILIEPSLVFSISDSTYKEFLDHIYPMVKIYVDNFCLGTYFYDKDRISIFFRYNYPGLYLGAFLSISRDAPYYRNKPSVELSAGINFSYKKSRPNKRFHW